jgi:hypothetical protein
MPNFIFTQVQLLEFVRFPRLDPHIARPKDLGLQNAFGDDSKSVSIRNYIYKCKERAFLLEKTRRAWHINKNLETPNFFIPHQQIQP